MRNGIAAVVLLLLVTAAHAQTTVPHTFTAGAAAKASEVNANFAALATGINNLASRVDRLEGGALTNASIAGTYRIFGFQTGLLAGTGPGTVETITYSGTLTLAPGGTYTGTLDEFAHDLFIGSGGAAGTMQTRNTPGEALSGTYSISQNTKLTLNGFGIDFYGAAGARILVATSQGEDPPPALPNVPMGTNVLLILVRTN